LVAAQQKNACFDGKSSKKGRHGNGATVFLLLDPPHRARNAKTKADQQKSAHLAAYRAVSHE